MYGCVQVLELWEHIRHFLGTFQIDLDISPRNILFGNHKESMEDVINVVILVTKGYIWKTKFDESPLIFNSFKKYLKNKLEDLKSSLEYIDKIVLFDQWNNIFASL